MTTADLLGEAVADSEALWLDSPRGPSPRLQASKDERRSWKNSPDLSMSLCKSQASLMAGSPPWSPSWALRRRIRNVRNSPNRCEVQNVVGEVTQPAIVEGEEWFSHWCLSPVVTCRAGGWGGAGGPTFLTRSQPPKRLLPGFTWEDTEPSIPGTSPLGVAVRVKALPETSW